MRIVIRSLCSCIRTYASCFVCSTIPSTGWRIRPDSWNHIVLVGASWGMHWIWVLRKWDESSMPSLVTVSISVDVPNLRPPCKIAKIQFNNGVQSFFTFENQWSFLSLPWWVWQNSLYGWSLLASGGWLQRALKTRCLLTVAPSECDFAHLTPGLDA